MPFIVKNAENAQQFVSQLAQRRENGEQQETEFDRYIRYLGYEIERQKSLPPERQDDFYILHLGMLFDYANRVNQQVKASVEALAAGDEAGARRQLQLAATSARRMSTQLDSISTSFDDNRTRAAGDILRRNIIEPLEREPQPPWKRYGALGGYYQPPEMPEDILNGGEIDEDEIETDMNMRAAEIRLAHMQRRL